MPRVAAGLHRARPDERRPRCRATRPDRRGARPVRQFVADQGARLRRRRGKQGFDLGGGFGKLTLTGAVDAPVQLSSAPSRRLVARLRRNARQLRRHELHRHRPPTAPTSARFVDTAAAYRVGINAIYRASIENKNFKDDPAGCASTFADGSDAPGGCRIASFTTFDLVGRLAADEEPRGRTDRSATLF